LIVEITTSSGLKFITVLNPLLQYSLERQTNLTFRNMREKERRREGRREKEREEREGRR
jgi:hypothetical protein